jgi:hypothetical protein
MTTNIEVTTIIQTNSTSYCDELGVLIGLSRLPGESSDSYIKRLKTATRIDVGQDYVGLLNELTLQLGLSISKLISLTSRTGNSLTVEVALTGIVITDTLTLATQTIPIVNVDIDDAWSWRLISDVVLDINTGVIATAAILGSDGPTIKLARQSNTLTVFNQPVSGQTTNLGFVNIITSSVLFNIPVPSYTLTSDGILTFSAPVLANTTITYKRLVWPYSIIGGDISLISLLDSSVFTMAQGLNGTIVYQIREAVQSIVARDLSYWGK